MSFRGNVLRKRINWVECESLNLNGNVTPRVLLSETDQGACSLKNCLVGANTYFFLESVERIECTELVQSMNISSPNHAQQSSTHIHPVWVSWN